MISPPDTLFAPWAPAHWITQTGYALSRRDLLAYRGHAPGHTARMHRAAVETQVIINRILQS